MRHRSTNDQPERVRKDAEDPVWLFEILLLNAIDPLEMRTLSFLPVHEECILRFPNLTLLKYRLYATGDLEQAGKTRFFETLFESTSYEQQRLAHANAGEHGPFEISMIRADHYQEIGGGELVDSLRRRLIPDTAQSHERWPDREAALLRFDALLEEMKGHLQQCYTLTLELSDEQYWSSFHREVGILDHFEEWVTVDTDTGVVYMLQLIRD